MNRTGLVIVIAILAVMVFGGPYLIAQPCIPVPTVEMSEWIDPNQVNYRLVAVFEIVEGEPFSKYLTACDENEDDLIFELEGEPNGLLIGPVDPNEAEMGWQACVKGTYYIDIIITDIPKANQTPLQDNVSFVLKVYGLNKPPVFGGCR